jgi:hypothetical protein
MNDRRSAGLTWSASSLHGELDGAAHEILEQQLPGARHLQADDVLAPLASKRARAARRLAIQVRLYWNWRLSALGGLALAVHLLGAGVVVVGVAAAQELVDRRLVAGAALRLEIGRERAADLRAFVPVEAEPAEPVEESARAPPRRCAAGQCRRCAGRICRRAAARRAS